MKRIASALVLLHFVRCLSATDRSLFRLAGAGGTGPFEVVTDWIAAFEAKYPEADLSIASIGTGAAQAALWGEIDCEAKPIEALCGDDRDARDQATLWGIGGSSLEPLDLKTHASKGLQQLPALGGPILVVYSKDVTGNLGSTSDAKLNMTFEVISGIFNGTIGTWDHPSLQIINPNIMLPSENITVLVRQDKSGMSSTFTEAIKHNIPSWPDDAVGKLPEWPAFLDTANTAEAAQSSRFHQANGQTGIGVGLLRRAYSVGYLEMGYYEQLTQFVSQAHISSTSNPSDFIKAESSTIQATMDGLVDKLDPQTLDMVIVNEDAPRGGYPISRYVHWYIKKKYTEYDSCYQAWLMYKFLEWCYTDSLAKDIAFHHGWFSPPYSVASKALDKLAEIQCIDKDSPETTLTTAKSYTPPPYLEQPDGKGLKIALSIVGSILGIILFTFLIVAVIRRVRAIRKLRQEHDIKMEMMLDNAQTSRQNIKYPFTLITAEDFISQGRLVLHEELRDEGKLQMYDTLSKVETACETHPVVFFSHQWASFDAPDPTGVQYLTMVPALETVVKEMGWNMKDVRVWVDYSCLPQRMRDLQTLAVQSLATYASTAHAFIITAPTCEHADLKTVCDKDTYQRRAWCRAEQVCHTLLNGPLSTYVATEEGIQKVQDSWIQQALHIFNGDLTCCQRKHKGMEICDRERLVVPILGLFGELYCNSLRTKRLKSQSRSSRLDGREEKIQAFFKEIEDNEEGMFPKEFHKVIRRKRKNPERNMKLEEDAIEVVTLFGDLVQRMKTRIEKEIDKETQDMTDAFAVEHAESTQSSPPSSKLTADS